MSESKLTRTLKEFLASDPGPARDRARDAVYTAHEFLVILTYGKFIVSTPRGIDAEDVLQLGRIALYDCIEAYAAGAGAEFMTYAIAGIRNAMTRAIKSLSWCRTSRVKEWDVSRVRKELELHLGRPATYQELSVALGVTLERLLSMIQEVQYNYPVYLGGAYRAGLIDDDRPSPVVDTIIDPRSVESYAEIRDAAKTIVEQAEKLFAGRELQVFYLLVEQASPPDIGRMLGISLHDANELARGVRRKLKATLEKKQLMHLYEAWAVGEKRKHPHRRARKKQKLAA